MAAIKGKKLDHIECPVCKTFKTKRLTMFAEHLDKIHKSSPQTLWNDLNNGPILCGCGCKQQAPWHGWKTGYGKFISGHNGSIYSSYDSETAQKISQQRSASLKGKPGWSKGLTKNTDERVRLRAEGTSIGRKRAFDIGAIEAWNKGLTKETDKRVAQCAKEASEAFTSGKRTQWHKGKTESTDNRVKLKNEQLRQRFKDGTLTVWHKGKTVTDDPRIAKFWQNRNAMLEYAHVRWTPDDIEKMLQHNTQIALQNIQSYKNDRTPALDVRCRTCDWSAKVTLIFAKTDRCPKCCPMGSNAQHEIANWLESLNVKVGRNVRGIIGRQELDIFIPIHKLAIEFNGLYYHNENAGKDTNYHQGKTDKCNKIGVRLIHVFEDEWRDKQEIVKSMILHKLGMSKTKIMARTCNVVQLDRIKRKAFFEANHVDGDTNASSAWGLEHDGTIVAAISLRTPFHRKYAGSLEVARFCSAINTSVAGGLGKLSSAVVTWAKNAGHTSLISYVDHRHGSGNSWQSGGWSRAGETSARFWWTDFSNRFNRFKFKADKSRNMTEAQVADEAQVVKIWGCRNSIYEVKLSAAS